jgi:hypothetical protein
MLCVYQIWMIIHDDGEREDLELEEIKASVVSVKEPFHWPAQADANRSLSHSGAVDVHPSADDETAFPPSMRPLSLTRRTPTSSPDIATTDAAHFTADTVIDAMMLLTQPPAAASSTMAPAPVSGTDGGEFSFAASPVMRQCRATNLQLV